MPLDESIQPPSKESDGGDEAMTTPTLWVGNLSSNTVDPDPMALFSKYGALDCTMMHGSRSYAFVYFKNLEDAKAAMDALQGAKVHGSSIKIDFARPAKPCKHLWIGGISTSLTKEQLEDEFLKFGKIEECKFFRDRNSSLIDYYKIEDAVAAQKNMNGKHLAGERIHVVFLRSQHFKREWPDHHNSRDGHISNRSNMGPPEPSISAGLRNFSDSSHHRPKRHLSYEGRRDGHPSNVLWIKYPPFVRINEQLLHDSMILFGEIESIKCFPSRSYSFVEFRSIDEARRAKEGLQGRLFGDPRIQILYSNSELQINKDNPPPFPGFPRQEMSFNEAPFGPLELFGPGPPMALNNFPGPLFSNSMPGPNNLMRPFAPQGFDPCHVSSEFPEISSALHNFANGNFNRPMPLNWRQRSPAPGLLPSPPGIRPPFGVSPGSWDGVDMRELKRSRTGGSSPLADAHFHAVRLDVEGIEDPFGFSHPDRGASGQIHHSPVVRGHGELHDHCWRGIIAKGGRHVCHARCVPIGKEIGSPFPDVVNCSARAGLDMLTKYYAEASCFNVVFFLPDSEEDFASYTEFLRYLGQKNSAGVAKLDDVTTLFLVPPSDFLTKVLNVSGPERLYGVVLKLLQQSASSAMQQPQPAIPTPPYMDQPQVPKLQRGFNFVPRNEDRTVIMDHSRSLHEGSMPRARVGNLLSPHANEPHGTQPASLETNPTACPQVEGSLTPELIATLASLIPANNQSLSAGTVQMPSSSCVRLASSSTSVMHDVSMPSQEWIQEHQVKLSGTTQGQPSYLPQQLGQQFNNQVPLNSQLPANIPYVQEPSLHMPQDPAVPPHNNYVIQSQSGQFTAAQENQQYQHDSSLIPHSNYNMLQTTDAAGVYNPPVQQLTPAASSSHGQTGNLSHPTQMVMPLPTDTVNMEFPSQGQQLQAVLSSSGQGTSEDDADRNQRYQTTLQFAASLLLQIQQQQQSSAQAVQGSGSQQ